MGGKRQLYGQLEARFPRSFGRYVEPFVGGGAVFFQLWNSGRLGKPAFLFDNNEELVNAFVVVRDKPEELIALLADHKRQHCEDHYYEMRELDRQAVALSDVERAARTIYMNRTCYNGLYRVNRKGQFNVPMGRYKNPKIVHENVLRTASAALQRVCVERRDFRQVVELARPGDFIYFDPPYDPVSKTARFTSYTAGSFGDHDQRDLAAVYGALTEKGCLCMLSNSHTAFVRELYGAYRIEVVRARRAVNSDANGRGKIEEVVVLNY